MLGLLTFLCCMHDCSIEFARSPYFSLRIQTHSQFMQMAANDKQLYILTKIHFVCRFFTNSSLAVNEKKKSEWKNFILSARKNCSGSAYYFMLIRTLKALLFEKHISDRVEQFHTIRKPNLFNLSLEFTEFPVPTATK